MTTTLATKSPCPECGRIIECATGPTPDSKPKEGSIGVCLSCGGIHAFRADLTIRAVTGSEKAGIFLGPQGNELMNFTMAIAARGPLPDPPQPG